MNFKMVHENYNVADLDKSMAFYEKALGLHEVRRINGDGFIIVYMGNEESTFQLELTWLEGHPEKYNLGECEFHLAFETDNYEAAHKLHEEMGCICFENPAMGIYFITDPDGYWLEIIPRKKQNRKIMKFDEDVKKLTEKVLKNLKEVNSSLYQFAQEAPGEISRRYYLLSFVWTSEYTSEERELAFATKQKMEEANEFTLEDAKFLRSHNGNNPKYVYWTKIIEELSKK